MKTIQINTQAMDDYREELNSQPLYTPLSLDRREFFKIVGSGLVVVALLGDAEGVESVEDRTFAAGKQNPTQVGAWIHIGKDDRITVYTGKVELGQNIRTSLSQAIADELFVPLQNIDMVMGDTFLTPYDRGTFGSLTTLTMSPQLRKAGAAARAILVDLAARQWNVSVDTLSVKDGKVVNGNRSISFGALTEGKQMMEVIPATIQMTSPETWPQSGLSIPKIGGEAFVTGRHQYPSDMKLKGMLYGKVLRAPAYQAKLKSVDTSKASKVSGVVLVQEGSFIAAAAPRVYQAEQAVDAIEAEWDIPDQISNAELVTHLKNSAGRESTVQSDGSLEEGRKQARIRLQAEYSLAYIAHTPLEPRSALAQWNDGSLTVWTGSQRPFGVQEELMREFRLPQDKVRVLIPDTGSGYGGKHTGDAAIESARLAKTAGKPVKVNWTREEEFRWAYFRPAGVITMDAGVTEKGDISAWEFHNYNSGTAGMRHRYAFPNQALIAHRSDSPLRQGSYRCLAASGNNFARESFLDELAEKANLDPLDFRLRNTTDSRLQRALTMAADKFGWGKEPSTPDRAFGLAASFEKNSYVVNCVEIAVDMKTGTIRVVRVVNSIDCGPVVNPDHLKCQIEGMIMMGIGGALHEEILFENGKILNARLARYRVPRFKDLPKIESVLIDPKDQPLAGAGENPITCIAPAIGNAVYRATGQRLRAMPLRLQV